MNFDEVKTEAKAFFDAHKLPIITFVAGLIVGAVFL